MAAPADPRRSAHPAVAAWRRLIASPVARAGLVIVLGFFLMAVMTPLLHRYDAKTDANLTLRLKPPTLAHPFGTDTLGRDLVVRVLHAAPVTLGTVLHLSEIGPYVSRLGDVELA